MFILTWAGALMFWKYGHVEEKWSARLRGGAITAKGADIAG
jgi:high-affinity nickel-transport protein